MFKINIWLRFALMGLCLVAGIILQITLGFGFSFMFWLVLIFLAVGYFLFGTISSASELLGKEDIDGAEQRLKLTWKPNWLLKMYRGYYYQLLGFIAAKRNDLETSEENLLHAIELGLPTNMDRATVNLQLASLNFNRRKFRQAETYLREVKKQNVKEPMILEQVRQMEQALKMKPSMGQMMSMQGLKGAKGRMKGGAAPTPNSKNNRKSSSKRKKK